MTESGGCCRCCFGFLFSSGLTALFLWLSLRTHKPKCSIDYFYIPALNQSSNSSSNSTVLFHLRLKNQNKDKSVFYDDLNLTLLYEANTTTSGRPVGNLTVPGFHQGRGKKAYREAAVVTGGLDWKAVPRNRSAVFRLNLATAVRYKIIFWTTKRTNLRLGAAVEVNEQGSKVYPGGITLGSGAAEAGGRFGSPARALWSVLVLVLFRFW